MSTENSSANLFANLSQQGGASQSQEAEQQGNGAEAGDDAPTAQMSEIEVLRQRCRLMGITFSNASKAETLRAKIQAKLDGDAQSEQASEDAGEDADGESDDQDGDEETAEVPDPEPVKAVAAVAPKAEAPKVEAPKAPARKLSLREELRLEQMALVRVRITNMDPKKKNLHGEIFTVANDYIGTVKKFVPYGEATDDGYHLPRCILTQLQERTFTQIKTVKNKNGRGTVHTTSDAREFAIEILPPLTPDELAQLAAAQAAAAGN